MTEPKKPYVIIATPAFMCQTSIEFCGSMFRLARLLTMHGIDHGWGVWPGLQFVDAARNFLVRDFLAKYEEATHIMFIDEDVGFPAEKVVEFLRYDEAVVCGAPPMKLDEPRQFPVFLKLLDNQPDLKQVDRIIRHEQHLNLLLAVQVPAGFLCVRRDVMETLARKAPTYAMTEATGALDVCFDIFQRGAREPTNPDKRSGEYVGEDTWFGQIAMAEGYKIWIDPDIDFTHRGTKTWKGNFQRHLMEYLAGSPKAQAVEMRLNITGPEEATITPLPAGEQVEVVAEPEARSNWPGPTFDSAPAAAAAEEPAP